MTNSPDDAETAAAKAFTGARRPDRHTMINSWGVALACHEWGAPDAPPVLLAHGGFDFSGTFHLLAPLLADAGWRVIAWDQRGHGDSEHATLYSWDADVRDALAVLDSITIGTCPVIGHSKGGNLMMQLADAQPHRISCLINLDGLPSKWPSPDTSDHERTLMLAEELASRLDYRRGASSKIRRPGTIDELAQRRAVMNPRLNIEWLKYLVTVGARQDEDGWRWKIDPSLRLGGFGPWRPEWALQRMPSLSMPFLGVLGLEPDAMSWGTKPHDVIPYLPPGGRIEALAETGHFVHAERPVEVSELILDFLPTI
ncbi:MAG: alpha/beta fold hydrolase [Acidimicrobiales bacterium]